jgi:hypothetical protein
MWKIFKSGVFGEYQHGICSTSKFMYFYIPYLYFLKTVLAILHILSPSRKYSLYLFMIYSINLLVIQSIWLRILCS